MVIDSNELDKSIRYGPVYTSKTPIHEDFKMRS